jgi:hypothetical protein
LRAIRQRVVMRIGSTRRDFAVERSPPPSKADVFSL